MAAFDFPSSPNNGDTYSANGIDWIYNGNVWKKDATAGVKGQKGEIGAGDKGDKGDKGIQGVKGIKGDKGDIGPQGGTGGVGDKGNQGDKGEPSTAKGDKGDQGVSIKGDKGNTGADNSTKGDKGDTGSTTFAVPSGGIIIWSGASNAIPSGWYLCNGSNGTPDLRNRFVIGAGSSYSVNATGGYTDVFIPQHTHTFSSSHTHSFNVTTGNNTHSHGLPTVDNGEDGPSGIRYVGEYGSDQAVSGVNTDNDTHTHNVSGTTNSGTASGTTANNTGGAAITNAQRSGRNLPPYYALYYIIKT